MYVLFFVVIFGSFTDVLVTTRTYKPTLVTESSWSGTSWRWNYWTVVRPRTESMSRTTHGITLASGTHVTGWTSFSLTTCHCVVIHFVGNSRVAWVVSTTTRSLSIDGGETEEACGTNTELWVHGLTRTSLGQMAPKVAFIKLVIWIRGSSSISLHTIEKTKGD